MKFNRFVIVFAVLFAFVLVPAYATTITFSEGGLAPGNALTNQLASLGVLFSVTSGSATIGSGFTPPVGSNIAGQVVVVESSPGPALVTVTFVDPSNSTILGLVNGSTIGVDLWNTEGAFPRATVTAYDINGSQLGVPAPLNGLYVNGAGGFSGQVHSLVISDTDSNGIVFDNLTFGAITDAVPEPATFLLVGTGLLGLSLALRQRKRI